MENHRFILEKYKGQRSRYTCPACDRKGEFARYLDTENKYTFPDHVGRCNNENRCGYHYTPKQFFADNPDERSAAQNGNSLTQVWNVPQVTKQPEKPIDYFDEKTMLATMKEYDRNSFVKALRLIFDETQIRRIIDRYKLGTAKSGAVVFWQVDTLGRVRYGKAMHYLHDLHRDKSKHPVGAHSLMGKHDFNHRQCFFGEHLLSLPENKNRTVAIVESEKSACVCSEAMPDYVWLATGGSSGIKWTDKNAWAYLQGRKVVLFPDVDAHQKWEEKAEIFRSFGIDVSIYDGLVKVAPGTQDDIADHIIIDLMQKKQKPETIMAENSAVKTEGKITRVNPVVDSMVAKNPALSRLMTTFDCEVTRTDTYEPKPSRMLTGDELKNLATGLPDHNSWTETELCRLLKIEPQRVRSMAEQKQIYFISQTGKYCRSGCTPF